MSALLDRIRTHPWLSFVGGLVTLMGAMASLYQFYRFREEYAIYAVAVYAVAFLILYLYEQAKQMAIRCFTNQSLISPVLLPEINGSKKTVKILSFTSETFFNQIGQKAIENLLDRGVEIKVLISSEDNPSFLLDDSRERYVEIIGTYKKRWKDLRKAGRSVEIRAYKSIPIFRGVIIDDRSCLIGTYYYPWTEKGGDPNYMFYFKSDLRDRNAQTLTNCLGNVFDYIWMRSEEV